MEKTTKVRLKKSKPRLNWTRAMKMAKVTSMYDLSQRLGVAYPNIFKLVDENANPKFLTICDYCKKLRIKVRDLIEE